MTQPTPLDETIEEGQPDHDGLHSEERARINLAVAKAFAAAQAAADAVAAAGLKLTPGPQGVQLAQLDLAAIRPTVNRYYAGSSWQARGTTSTNVTATWWVYPGQPTPTAAQGVIPDHDEIVVVSA